MRPARLFALILLTTAIPASAQVGPGGWGRGWGAGPMDRPYSDAPERLRRNTGAAEGKVEVSRFLAEDGGADLLGKGAIAVGAAPLGENADLRELSTYEAAVVDRLAGAGYRTDAPDAEAAQQAELRVTHAVRVPEEAPHKPVSGSMEMGVSNHGSMMGLGLAIDLSKPKKALISTRLEARIRDRASGKVLWEGRADIVTREGSDKWTEAAIAAKLAEALFAGFPTKTG